MVKVSLWSVETVILSEAKDLGFENGAHSGPEMLRFAQHDVNLVTLTTDN